ncbi:non-hydrolyzing UDP-N-acetylglucosamine 2-epimerase [Lentibacillus salinarum]|uniref:Non-hydrolyzing UDP-N-acetylglucosamine 2-epimerase n=1 Tax=Lentibacillus salinarum TaxID=446820 RepID=A0ABW3ZSU0_9BACI
MKLITITGTRPQFIKAGMLSKLFRAMSAIDEIIVNTGQHYDDNMSTVFIDQLQLPAPDYDLGIGSGSHGKQTAGMLTKLEDVMMAVKPDMVLVYGDTNSTLAGSLAASKLHIPVAHVEAGLRSFNKKMPEEINRIVADHVSDWLFCPSETAVSNLRREGIEKGVYRTGDIMYDAVVHFKPVALDYSSIRRDLSLRENDYYLATVHRAENTDDPQRLRSILEALNQLHKKVVIPMHPRTRRKMDEYQLMGNIARSSITIVNPLNYFDMLALTSGARAILTDSGGLQKEAYMLRVPCITLRDETEWPETVHAGWNQLTGADTQKIADTLQALQVPNEHPPLFGDGKAARTIAEILIKECST